MKYPTPRKSAAKSTAAIIWAFLLLAHSTGPVYGSEARSPQASVQASGPEAGQTLEDKVEIMWTVDAPIAATSTFHIERNGTLIRIAAPGVNMWDDLTAVPGTPYEYCVWVYVDAADVNPTRLGCDQGERRINAPTGVEATDGEYEDFILVDWSDRSEIEGGFNLYRSGGRALNFDGSDDFVQIPGIVAMSSSFSFEFWAKRSSTNTDDFVINMEFSANGDPTNVDLELGFSSAKLQFRLGDNNTLEAPGNYTDTGWHHYAFAYDGPNQRRFIYVDGVRVATDVTPTMFRPSGELEFGRREPQGSPKARGYFHGAIDEVRYWNTALTEEQVADRMLALLNGGEAAMSSYWPMDAPNGLIVPDVFGGNTGNMVNMAPNSWAANVLTLYAQIGPNLTSFVDQSATTGFQSFTYELAAFEDIDENGSYEAATDYESAIGLSQTDDGWRGYITPPGNVSASDGQFNDRVVVTWNDLSEGESSYNIYRDDVLVGTVAADVTTFAYLTGDVTENVYCVAGVGGGLESVRGCDPGRAGGLAPPADVRATDTQRFRDGDPTQPIETYDDRVIITWSDTTDTEDGFEVRRGGNMILATLDADNQEYNDFSAVQGQAYDYCVRAFSLADPLAPAYSSWTCAPSPGVRVVVRDPENLQATDYAFEERVELSWENPSTTAMLFMVYRGGSLVQVLDFNMTSTVDTGIPSDEDINYCVSAATVTSMNPSATISVQGQIAQVLGTMRHEDEIRLKLGEAPSTLEDKLTAVRDVMSLEAAKTSSLDAGSANVLGIQGLVESGMSCDIGGRTLAPPTDVVATNDEFESHVEVSWVDNSLVERGYNIYRSGTVAPIAVISANRTTYEDYTGTPGLLFNYTVEAFDDDDVSTSDSGDGKRTLKAPTALAAADGTSETSVEMSWKDNSAAEFGYRIFRRDNGIVSDPFVEIGTSGKNENGFTDVVSDPADLGKIFQYKVVAFDDYGESLAALDLGNTMLVEPGNVNASDVYDGYVTVVWVDRSNVEQSYEVTRREYSSLTSAPATLIATVLSGAPTSITDVPTDHKQYQYCVTTKLASGVPSDTVCDIGKLFGTDGGGSGSGPDPVQPYKITSAPYPLVSGDKEGVRFGTSVAISGSTALIGAPGGNPFRWIAKSQGLGFNVVSLDATNNVWGQANYPIEPPLGGIFWDGAEFGHSVDINGNYMILGDPYVDDDQNGTFSLFRLNGLNRTLLIRDSGNQGSPNAGFSVAMADSFAIVGDNQLNTTKMGHGGAIICDGETRNGSGCRRNQDIPKLEDLIAVGDQAVNAEFGYAVDIVRNSDVLTAMVGAPGDEKAYLFSCNVSATADADTDKVGCSLTSDWTLERTFESLFAVNARFGSAVAIGDGVLVVGAPGARAIAMYQLSATQEWVEIPPALNALASDFGAALKVWDNLIIVGAPAESIAGIDSSGAVYVYDFLPATNEAVERVRYDARAGDRVRENARFGSSVDFDGFNYLIGAPGDDGAREGDGAVYSIPLDFEPPTGAVIPEDVELATPGEIRASDGTAPDRIQVRWDDESEDEDGHIVYRGRMDGTYERLGETPPNVEFFDDFEAAPGDAYSYCVTAYFDDAETDPSCDIGWRPPNGTISGRIAERAGTGTEGATVCLVPEPNMSLIFDGAGGFLDVPVGEELDLSVDFSIEAWVRPHKLDGTRYIVSKYADWGLALVNGQPQFRLFRDVDEKVALDGRTINTNEWTHVAATFGANNLQRNVTFFINGIAGTTTDLEDFSRVISDTLTIGHRGDKEDPISMTYFNGEIDEVRIWAGTRTAEQIDSLMSVPLTGEEENLLGYWPLDQGNRLVSADLSESANHATLIRGVYLADSGTDLDVCTVTEDDGNYSFSGIRYGELTEFSVIPKRPGRAFSPSFKKISLAVETPVQNEIFFTDVTAYGVSGLVQYIGDDFMCPVPEVVMHASKGDVPSDDNIKVKTRADGSFTFSVDPSTSESDTWYIMPTYSDAQTGSVHSFVPENIAMPILDTTTGLSFNDDTRSTLTGYFTGGDPLTCHKNIGTATIRLYTQDGCFDREFTVNSADNNGAFPDDLDLPPLRYLMEVVAIENTGAVPAERFADIQRFFDDLGAVEVDMRQGPVERSLIYRAPLTLAIRGLEEGVNSCSVAGGITQTDEDGNPIRVLPDVRIIPEFAFQPLSIEVMEDYGNGQMCGVETGTVTIFDAIADRVDADSTMSLDQGVAEYSTFGASPNIFSGARIQGVDRSFQKPLTVVAQVEGRKTLLDTEWALVEGTRERSSTFVSATTEEFPLMVLFDPPGSNSSAFIEEGNKMCTSISDTKLVGGGAGVDLDIALGFVASLGFSFGAHFDLKGGAGLYITTRTTAGRDDTSLNGRNIEICMTTTQTLSTSNDMTWVGEDILTGVALNLIFALADVLETQDSCEITLTETLATDLNHADPFETFYTYGKSHIALSLIPELENLIRVGGDATVTGDIDDQKTTVRLTDALANWKKQLAVVEQQKEEGLADEVENHSFSGGTEFAYVEAADSTVVTSLEAHRIYFDSQNAIGFIGTGGYDQKIGVAFDIRAEWNYEKKKTEGGSRSIGYTLSDGDTGDYFSVDVGTSPRYGTKVFGTRSGRSSNPWEANTQKRDNPIILVDPPVMYDVDPEGAANFQLTLINGSESNEQRQYTMAVPGETNTGNLGVTVTGDLLGGQRLESFLLDPGKALTINMDVLRVSPPFSYKDVGVILYPETEMNIWKADTRQPFALSDTAFFSVFFDSTGGNVMTKVLAEGWNWISINRDGGLVESVFSGVPIAHGDLIRDQFRGSKFDSTLGWVGDLKELTPGEGYRLRVSRPGSLRLTGAAAERTEPINLAEGWNWVGYVPATRTHIAEALSSLSDQLMAGDAVVGQDGFAQYVPGAGWVGTLVDMEPGQSYAINVNRGGELAYPLKPTNTDRPVVPPRIITVEGPEWTMPSHEYTTSMTVVAEVKMAEITLDQTTTKIAVFSEGQIRGTGDVLYVESLDKHLAFIQVFGEFEDIEDLRVHVFDGETEILYEDVAAVDYSAQTMIGSPMRPVLLDLSMAGQAPALNDLPEEFILHPSYPNPFSGTSTIGYDLPEAADVRIEVYDLLGRRVMTLVDSEQPAGRHEVVFDGQRVTSGIYFYRMTSGGFKDVGKMVVVK